MIQLTLTLKMTSNNSPIQDYLHPDDQTQCTFEMTPGFKPFTVITRFEKRTKTVLQSSLKCHRSLHLTPQRVKIILKPLIRYILFFLREMSLWTGARCPVVSLLGLALFWHVTVLRVIHFCYRSVQSKTAVSVLKRSSSDASMVKS